MTSSAAFAQPYPPHVGNRLVVALARALSGRNDEPGAEPLRSKAEAADPAGDARGIALALRDTCRVVAADLAHRPAARPAPLGERLCATAGEIGEVLALFDRTTEQMHRLANDALAAVPASDAMADGLSVVATEVRDLSLHTRRASHRVAEQVQSLRGGAGVPKVARKAAEISWIEGPARAAAKPSPAAESPASDREFSLLNWLSAREAGPALEGV